MRTRQKTRSITVAQVVEDKHRRRCLEDLKPQIAKMDASYRKTRSRTLPKKLIIWIVKTDQRRALDARSLHANVAGAAADAEARKIIIR